MRESAASSFIRKISGTLFVVALGFVMVAWIKVSQPFDPDQVNPVEPTLNASTIADAESIPAFKGSVVSLAYHGVSDTDHSGSTLSRQRFAEHMQALKTAGFETVTLDEVQKLVDGDPVDLPPKAMLLTFDGGHLTDWTNVDPVLKKLGYNAVAFLTTSAMVEAGTPSYHLSFDQVQKLKKTGRWEFGSHTHDAAASVDVPGDIGISFTNRIIVKGNAETPDQWTDRIEADLQETQAFFKENLGAPAVAFSYPNGDPRINNNLDNIQGRTEKLLKSAGFSYAFYGEDVATGQVDGITKESNRYRLPRIGIRATTSVTTLLRDVRGAVPVLPPKDLTKAQWTGDYTVACRVRGRNIEVGSSAYGICKLDTVNTRRWHDYTVKTVIKTPVPRQVAFIAVRDGEGASHNGSLMVIVGAGKVIVRQQLNGGKTLQEIATGTLGPGVDGRRAITIKVSGSGPDNQIVVNVTGLALPLTAKFSPTINAGGVKFGVDGYRGKHITYVKPHLIMNQEVTP